MTLYRDKYLVESTRLKYWDYTANGYYYVTICVQDRQYLFGNVIGKKMYLSEIGLIANKYWLEIPNHFPFVKLDEYVIMPNHIHAILAIEKNNGRDEALPRLYKINHNNQCTDCDVRQNNYQRVYPTNTVNCQTISPKPRSLSVIIGSYKSICTKTINTMMVRTRHCLAPTIWQGRYYDHIIRNDKELNRIVGYIADNPSKWDRDRNNIF